MFFRRFYDDQLAQASYLVGCQATGEALVVDPNRDVEPYVRAAEAEHLRVTHVTETHIHADFVSGARELARRAGARLLLSDAGGADWRYRYAAEDGATLLADGDRFQVGRVEVTAMHTPGHTPEHMTFLVTDTAAAAEPMGALTGRLRLRGRRRATGPARAGRPCRRDDGGQRPPTVRIAAAGSPRSPTTSSSGRDTGRARRAARPSARCRSPRWDTSGGSTGRSRRRARRSSCARCSRGSRIRRATSRR